MVTKGFKALIAEANAVIETIPVKDALALVGDPKLQFVDIRETVEVQKSGTIKGAVHAPRGFLEFIADPASPMHKPEFSSGKGLILFCASGGRSTLAARTLMDMGFTKVAHVAGGFAAWQAAGGATE